MANTAKRLTICIHNGLQFLFSCIFCMHSSCKTYIFISNQCIIDTKNTSIWITGSSIGVYHTEVELLGLMLVQTCTVWRGTSPSRNSRRHLPPWYPAGRGWSQSPSSLSERLENTIYNIHQQPGAILGRDCSKRILDFYDIVQYTAEIWTIYTVLWSLIQDSLGVKL